MLVDYGSADVWRPFRWKSAFSFVFSGRFDLINFDIVFASYLGTGKHISESLLGHKIVLPALSPYL